MTDETYKAGIIGLGFIGGADQVSGDALGQQVQNLDGTHFHALKNHPRIEIVAGSSRDHGRRERFENRSGAKTYANWMEMIEKERLDLVSIATYTPQHHELTLACAAQRIPVIFCEKPIATRLSEADDMLRACEEAGSLLIINHQRRFNPLFRRLRDSIEAGKLGELTSISMDWPNGRLGNVGTHMIDSMRMLLQCDVAAVSGHLDLSGKPDCRGSAFADPGGWGTMRMENNLRVMINAPDYSKVPQETRINGSKGRAIVKGYREIQFEFWEDGQIEQWAKDPSEGSSMDTAVKEAVEWLDSQKPFPYPGAAALGTQEAIAAFHASHAKDSAWISLPLVGSDREIEVNSG